jgi:LDH2 family malate/lactate/ureidoglycolate dehydrogenase
LIPGDPERDALAYRLEHGVPVVQRVVDDLTDVARRRGVPLPEPLA